jgi:hypothetical protein
MDFRIHNFYMYANLFFIKIFYLNIDKQHFLGY